MIVRPIEILLVEDNEGDIILAQEAFREGKLRNNLHIVRDGEDASSFMFKKGEFVNAPTPDLVLLDLNLPKKDGRALLAEVKADDNLKRIPVVIMTSSKSETDVLKSYELHANSYLVKPLSMENFANIVTALENFWFSIVVLPTDDGLT